MKIELVSNPKLPDFTQVIDLFNQVFCEFPNFKKYLPEVSMAKTKNAKDVIIIKAYDNDRLAGFAMCYDRYPGYFHLWELGVLKEHRHKGIASAIYNEVEAYARKKEYRGITMATFNIYQDSLRLALKRGYEIYGIDKTKEFEGNPKISLRLSF